KRESLLETRRDEGGLKVRDSFILHGKNEEAFCEHFGVVAVDSGVEMPNEREEKDNVYVLWMTVSLNGQFTIGEQWMDRIYSKDGQWAETFYRLREEYAKTNQYVRKIDDGPDEFDETVLIIGFDPKSRRFFSTSRSGEAFINETVWKKCDGAERGAVFRARLSKEVMTTSHLLESRYRVSELYERIDGWEGVEIQFGSKDINVTVDAKVMERRRTCYALETKPFGLVTYPIGKNFLLSDLTVGDRMRVRLYRFKQEFNDDHPSKLQVVSVIRMLERETMMEEWFEGIVTNKMKTRVFINFNNGFVKYLSHKGIFPDLPLGTVVDIRARKSEEEEELFDILEIGRERKQRKDIRVEVFDDNKQYVCCRTFVAEERSSYFLLDTPIIGHAMLNYIDAPSEMRVGEEWEVKMMRMKEKGECSFWMATGVIGRWNGMREG
ncbi:hypothetical protein PFISCL1PPCAC_16258, partial [Pristionchus fissidentatus]